MRGEKIFFTSEEDRMGTHQSNHGPEYPTRKKFSSLALFKCLSIIRID